MQLFEIRCCFILPGKTEELFGQVYLSTDLKSKARRQLEPYIVRLNDATAATTKEIQWVMK